jgi:O-antigen/teichoic acid export membrane protein
MKKQHHKLAQNIFFQTSILLTVANLITGSFTLTFNIIVGRYLGPATYGEVATFFSYLVLMTFPVSLNYSFILEKIGHRDDPKDFSFLMFERLKTIFIKRWYIIFAPILITPFLPTLTNLSFMTSCVLIFMIYASMLSGWYDSILQGRHKYILYIFLYILLSLFQFSGSISTAFFHGGILVIFIFICVGMAVKITLSHIFLHSTKKYKKDVQKIGTNFSSILYDKQLWLSLLFSVSLILISNIDIIYVKKMFSAEDAGLYGAWNLYAKMITYMLGPFLSVAFIYFSNKKQRHQELVLSLSVIALIFLSMFVFIIFDSYRNPLLHYIFGNKYIQLYPFMDWAGIFGATYFIIYFFMNFYLAKGSKRTLILPFTIPIYLISIIIFGKNPRDVMMINVLFCSTIASIFLLDYFFIKLKATFFN